MACCHQMGARRPTLRDLASTAAPATSAPQQPRQSPAAWFLDGCDGDDADGAASSGRHFLDECRMCGTHLDKDRDIYMYKGDTPFCSEGCRDEQVRIDEHEERANRRRRRRANAASSAGSSPAEVRSRAAAVAVGAV